MKPILLLVAGSIAAPASAQDSREMGAHVHGVSTAEIAIEHGMVAIDLLSPGMDIVGFEYAASSDADKDAVEAAIRQFLTPELIVTLPDAAGCRLTGVLAHLHAGGHGDTQDAAQTEHDHENAADHDHEDHAEGEHQGHAAHSEFHVTYAFACADEAALTSIGFPFFARFQHAQKIEVQYVTETGAGTAELTRDAPNLGLE